MFICHSKTNRNNIFSIQIRKISLVGQNSISYFYTLPIFFSNFVYKDSKVIEVVFQVLSFSFLKLSFEVSSCHVKQYYCRANCPV